MSYPGDVPQVGYSNGPSAHQATNHYLQAGDGRDPSYLAHSIPTPQTNRSIASTDHSSTHSHAGAPNSAGSPYSGAASGVYPPQPYGSAPAFPSAAPAPQSDLYHPPTPREPVPEPHNGPPEVLAPTLGAYPPTPYEPRLAPSGTTLPTPGSQLPTPHIPEPQPGPPVPGPAPTAIALPTPVLPPPNGSTHPPLLPPPPGDNTQNLTPAWSNTTGIGNPTFRPDLPSGRVSSIDHRGGDGTLSFPEPQPVSSVSLPSSNEHVQPPQDTLSNGGNKGPHTLGSATSNNPGTGRPHIPPQQGNENSGSANVNGKEEESSCCCVVQ